MSSAQSAASAAFKGTYQTPKSSKSNKPKLRLLIDTATNGSRTSLAAAQMSQQRSQSKTNAPSAARLATTPIVGLGLDTRSALPKPISRRANTTLDDDLSSVVLANSDYFSSRRVYGSSSLEVAMPTPQRLRTSINTNPQDMLEQVRQSINSKSKSGVRKDVSRNPQAAIDEFRYCVDQHRIKFQLSHDVATPVHGEAPSDLGSVYNQPTLEINSRSSFGSTASQGNDDVAVAPIIKLINTTSIDADLPRKPLSIGTSSAIVIPPSPNAVARAADTSDSNIPVLLLLIPFSASTASLPDDTKMKLMEESNSKEELDKIPEEPKTKARRKPPPEFQSEDDVSLSEYSLNFHLSDAEEAEEEQKLPIFPGFPEKHKKHKLFGRKTKKGVPLSKVPLDNDSDESQEFIPSRSATPIVSSQQVKFKTTMRKVNKRREKKTAFNEDKPWKNHSELDYVSEQQRKRYEGVWVSNRGLYMSKVVTRLVGVNYDKDNKEDSASESNKKLLSEKEISQRAAKLSSRTAANVEVREHDIQKLHGLVDTDVHDLIHGVVVKRIWNRSRLSQEVLASIWDLVDYRKDGTLSKAEFIVGMWLVDQCLYGRKLPKEVNELVWSSVGNIGVRVVIKKKRR